MSHNQELMEDWKSVPSNIFQSFPFYYVDLLDLSIQQEHLGRRNSEGKAEGWVKVSLPNLPSFQLCHPP